MTFPTEGFRLAALPLRYALWVSLSGLKTEYGSVFVASGVIGAEFWGTIVGVATMTAGIAVARSGV